MKRCSLSTLYGVGLLRGMPGTYGSLAAALLAYPVLGLPHGWAWLLAGAALFSVLGTAHAARFMRDRNTTHDPREIVIDELVGQWLTYSIWHGWLLLMAGTMQNGMRLLEEVAASPAYLALGFVLFRLFDIVKPWPIGWVDRRVKGGLGVMLDDVVAAIPAGTLLYLAYLFSPLLLGHPLEVNP